MRIENFILSIVRKLETIYPGTIAFAHREWNGPRTYGWWCVCISDLNIYMNDKRFKVLCSAWRKAGKARGVNVVFCACMPHEKNLNKFAEEENLIMNV